MAKCKDQNTKKDCESVNKCQWSNNKCTTTKKVTFSNKTKNNKNGGGLSKRKNKKRKLRTKRTRKRKRN